ncbi:hypothetical protein Ddye_027602 [Dipteronia dyeriana]|uniref:Glycosyltransferase 61 catalytic domain-containing protein n=1 Tax=Dipteronia dyeriana TaxID=168575 RepID=A0AAD9TPV4_9ROSI|nr:hypothetical protein Ddye_027602 [Dipteronia dyeriana]
MVKEQQKLVIGATSLAFLLLLPWIYVAFFHVNPLEAWKHKLTLWRGNDQISSKKTNSSMEEVNDPLEFPLRRLVRGEDRIKLDNTGFSCHSDLHSDLCVVNKPVKVDKNASTVYIISYSNQSQVERLIKPYALQDDQTAMKWVSPIRILNEDSTSTSSSSMAPCRFTHNVPAVVFSSGGFTGNQFHEIDEIIIPLFITTRHFRSRLKFVITDFKPWWVSKYRKILKSLSRYEVINPAVNGSVHCFPGAVMGLKYHDYLAFNMTDIPGGYSMFDFRNFLRQSYNLKIKNVKFNKRENKPVLILLCRQNSRRFLNENEMADSMEELGFEVVVITPSRMLNLDKFTEVVNRCSVMVGAHGAGLTNEMFLPDGAVVVQVVPLALDLSCK